MASGPSTAAAALELSRPKADRLYALDGLRGAAAVAVLLFHATSHIAMPSALLSLLPVSPLGPLVNGPGAVHVFFVLSGYVLALTLQGDGRPGWLARYYVRRVFRIQPPYMAAVLLAWAATRVVIPAGFHDPNAPWLRLPAAALPVALAFPSRAFGLLPVGWSLFVEMAMSVVFPLLFLLGRRVHSGLPIALSVLFLRDLPSSWVFLRFMIDFAIGLSLRLEGARVAALMGRLPAVAPALLAVAGLALLQLPYVAGLMDTGFAGLEHGHTPAAVAQLACGAGLLLVAAMHAPRLRQALSSPLGRFFGRTSYSFYLIHYTVLLSFVMHARTYSLPWPTGIAVTLLTFAVTTALSELGWRFVEAPAIGAGRWVIRAGGALFQRAAAQ
ncbi:MAG TPA: acyltransferase [Myxococcota bacterium]|nr:acyltransferase [Myxococcota bacterium]